LGTSGSSWYKVQFGSQVAYVYAADVWLKGSGSTSGSSGLVYASYSVRVYKEASTSSAMLGYLYAGDTATRTGSSSNGWTRIDFDGRTGYVQTSRITVITGSTSGGSMSTLNRWMYAKDDYTYCYSVPSESKSYREGYLDEGERVWALAGNSDWIKIMVDDEIYYVPANDLSSSGSYYYDDDDGDYSVGSYVYVAKYAGAATYANTSRSPFYVSGESDPYGKLSRGTRLTVKGQVGSLLLVSFRDDRDDDDNTGKTLTAYVDVDLVSSSRP
ncbi:MAG: SH3 domain-containing protein, partial [Bacillota bacterium]